MKFSIPRLRGVWREGDVEDVPLDFVQELKNLKPRNGQAEKTFGLGPKSIPLLAKSVPNYQYQNIATFFTDHVFGGLDYVVAEISDESNHLILSSVYGGVRTVEADYANLQKFDQPYLKPDSLTTWSLTSSHTPAQSGTFDVDYTIAGYASLPATGFSYQARIGVITDIFYSLDTQAVAADGDFTISSVGLTPGTKMLKLERLGPAFTAASLVSYDPGAKTLTILGGNVSSGAINEGQVYYVVNNPITYNSKTYAAGESFAGAGGVTTFTGSGDVLLFGFGMNIETNWSDGNTVSKGYFRVLRASFSGTQTTITVQDSFDAVIGWGITAIDPATEKVTLFGNHTALFTPGKAFKIHGNSAGNDGDYTVLSSVYSAPNTIIDVNEDLTGTNGGGYVYEVTELRPAITIAESYPSRGVIRSYNVPLSSRFYGQLGGRTFGYDHAQALIVACARGDATNADRWVSTLMDAILPVANGVYNAVSNPLGSGTDNPNLNDIPFSYFSHGYDPTTTKILAPDPYCRVGASMWVVYSLLFYCHKYPAGAHYAAALAAGQTMLDKLIGFPTTPTPSEVGYLVVDSESWQNWLFRGGRGQYDISDLAYPFDGTRVIKWCSNEHNTDAVRAIRLAQTLSLTPDADCHIGANELNMTYGELADKIVQVLYGDVANGNGLWIPAEGRALQGITGTDIIEATAGTPGTLRVNGDLTGWFTAGFQFQINESTGNDNSGTAYSAVSSVLDTTPIAEGDPVLTVGRYYRVLTVTSSYVTHDGTPYAVGKIFRARTTGFSGGTVALNETVITVASLADGTDDGVIVYHDYAVALDACGTWYATLAKAEGYDAIAQAAADYITEHFGVNDLVYPSIRGFQPYKSNVPNYPASSPWNNAYGDSVETVPWVEGTAYTAIMRIAMGDFANYQQHINDILPARDVPSVEESGYAYVTFSNSELQAEAEMQTWASLGATAPMILAHDPNGFWGLDISTISGLNSTPHFHAASRNPLLMADGIFRLLPGAADQYSASFTTINEDSTGDTVTLQGDRRDFFPINRTFTLTGTNAGTYTVEGVALNANGDTVVSVATIGSTVASGGNTVSVSDPARPVWLGYIDREFFDGRYAPNPGFEEKDARVVAPDLDGLGVQVRRLTTTTAFGFADGDIRYYKFSYVYDGVQESLLSDGLRVEFDADNQFAEFAFDIATASHNRRITAIKIYRSATFSGAYQHIQTVDFLRGADRAEFDDTDGGYLGLLTFYIPELADYNFDGGKTYRILVDTGSLTTINTVSGTGNTVFTSTATAQTSPLWNKGWYLRDDTAGTVVRSGDDGGFVGSGIIILARDFGDRSMVGSIIHVENLVTATLTTIAGTADPGITRFTFAVDIDVAVGDEVTIAGLSTLAVYNGTWEVVAAPSATQADLRVPTNGTAPVDGTPTGTFDGRPMLVEDSIGKALLVSGAANIDLGAVNKPWRLAPQDEGLFTTAGSTTVTVKAYDNNLPDGPAHPLAGEVSVDVNGRYARIVGRRLFQGFVILDPEGVAEKRADWLAYSELGQYDVMPVSNVLNLSDLGGGEITGLDELLGRVVIAKRNAILNIHPSSPVDPSTWELGEAVHNIGNLAEDGMIVAHNRLFVCHEDGIYALTLQNISPTDATPPERLRVSVPIEPVYQALTRAEKEAIKVEYSAAETELWYTLGTELWALSLDDFTWRQIDSDTQVQVWRRDELGSILALEPRTPLAETAQIYSSGDLEAVGIHLKTKPIQVGDAFPNMIQRISVHYKSATALTMNLYRDYETTPARTITLPAATSWTHPYRAMVMQAAHRIELEVIDAADSTSETIIRKIGIETSRPIDEKPTLSRTEKSQG